MTLFEKQTRCAYLYSLIGYSVDLNTRIEVPTHGGGVWGPLYI